MKMSSMSVICFHLLIIVRTNGRCTSVNKVSVNSGFYQIQLTKDSQLLTIFISPFGRFCYQRLPFGINLRPEHYQRQIQRILGDMEGVVCLMDDIVVYGDNEQSHDKRL